MTGKPETVFFITLENYTVVTTTNILKLKKKKKTTFSINPNNIILGYSLSVSYNLGLTELKIKLQCNILQGKEGGQAT